MNSSPNNNNTAMINPKGSRFMVRWKNEFRVSTFISHAWTDYQYHVNKQKVKTKLVEETINHLR